MPTSTRRHLSAVATSKSHEDSDGAVLDGSYPDTYLDCRTIQHDWHRIGCYHAYGELVRVLHCNRCGTDRHDHWSASGHRMRAATYDYPDDYKLSGGPALWEVRRESISRMTIYESADALNAAILGGRKRAAGTS